MSSGRCECCSEHRRTWVAAVLLLLASCAAQPKAFEFATAAEAEPTGERQAVPPHGWLADFAALQQLEELGDTADKEGKYSLAARYFAAAAAEGTSLPSQTGTALRIKAAKAFVRSNQADAALAQLRYALAEGFRNDLLLKTDAELQSLASRPEFARLVQDASGRAREFAATHRSAENAKLEFGDVERFWVAYDLAQQTKSSAEKAVIFRAHYLAPGTPGLIDFFRLKIQSAEALVARIESMPGYYAAIRAPSLTARELEMPIRDGIARLLALYPEAEVPDVTFVVGRLNSGGTAGPAGMLIGLDIWSAPPDAPLDGLSVGMQELIRNSDLKRLPFVVLHEHVHALQVYAREDTLLEIALAEGTADFLAGLALPDEEKPYYYRWGLANEKQVWAEFEKEMSGKDVSRWIANQNRATSEWSADLGYFVGARIAEAYYARATDKTQAIRDLLIVGDASAVLKASGYGPK